MTTADSIHHTAHTLDYGDLATVELPAALQLESRVDKFGVRRWWVRSGSTSWHLPAGWDTSERIGQWLADRGYQARGTMPPDCFEFVR